MESRKWHYYGYLDGFCRWLCWAEKENISSSVQDFWRRIKYSCFIFWTGGLPFFMLFCFAFCFIHVRKINCTVCSFWAARCITVTFSHTWKQSRESPASSVTREAGSYTNTHTLHTHTLLGGRSHKWSWPLRCRIRGGKRTPFLALDLQRGGLLRPLERRGQEFQRADLLMWIPCNLTPYRESKCCLKSSRHFYRCQSLVLKGPG